MLYVIDTGPGGPSHATDSVADKLPTGPPRSPARACSPQRLPNHTSCRYAARLAEESARVTRDQIVFNLPRPKRVAPPLLVFGAEDDGTFTPEE